MTNPNAWTIEQLLEHAEWIRKLAHMLVRDPVTADDLAQDTWVQALRSPPKQQGPLKPWLAAILRNLVRERFRKTERRERRELAADGPRELAPADDLAQRAEAQKLVVEFVLELAPHYRDVVLLSYFEGLSGPDIAERMDIPEVTVRSRLKRGLDQLRERFDRKYGDRKAWVVMLMPLAKRPNGGGVAPSNGTIEGANATNALSLPKIALSIVVAAAVVTPLIRWAWIRDEPLATESAQVVAAPPDEPLPDVVAPVERQALNPEPTAPASIAVPMGKYEATVVRADGTPASGARIEVRQDVLRKDSPNLFKTKPHVFRLLANLTADERGRFEFEHVCGSSFDILIDAPGQAPFQAGDRTVGSVERLRLSPTASMYGTVHDPATGVGIGGAVVVAMWLSEPDGIAETKTAADGSYRIDGLPPEQLVFSASAAGFTELHLTATLVAGRATELNFPLYPGRALVGVVRDSTTGDPIAGAEVGMLMSEVHVRSGADGTFKLTGYTIEDYNRPYVRAVGYGYRELWSPVPEGTATEYSTEIGLEKAVRFSGTIVSEDGVPLADAWVIGVSRRPDPTHTLPHWRLGHPRADLRSARTGSRGEFVLTELRPDTRHLLLVIDARAARVAVHLPPNDGPGTQKEVGEIRIPRPRTIIGIAVADDGSPVAGERISLQQATIANQQLCPVPAKDEPYTLELDHTVTDIDGRFAFTFAAPGWFQVETVDLAGRTLAAFKAKLTADDFVVETTLRIKPTLDITGRVTDAHGNPQPFGELLFLHEDAPETQRPFVEVTNQRGEFRLRNLLPGRYGIRSWVIAGERAGVNVGPCEPIEVEAGTRDVHIVLPDIQWVAFRPLDEQGQLVMNVHVACVPVSGTGRTYVARAKAVDGTRLALSPNTEFNVTVTVPAESGKEELVHTFTHTTGSVGEPGVMEIRLSGR